MRVNREGAKVFQKYWQPEMVVTHILARKEVEPLNAYYYATNYPSVHAAAVRIWGSWRDAIEACGLDYSTIRKYRVWSDKQVLEEIVELHKLHSPLSSKLVQTEHKPLYMAAIRRFGSWSETLRRAGLDSKRIRLRQARDPEEIKAEIRKLYRAGVSLAYPNMRENYPNLLASAMKKIGDGSWNRARKICGVKENYRVLGQRRRVENSRTGE